jgi:nitroreductase
LDAWERERLADIAEVFVLPDQHLGWRAQPMIITVVMQENTNHIMREEDYASTSYVIHNFSLLAWERGIGLVWETYPWLLEAVFRDAMDIRPGEKVLGNLHVGYPAQIPNAQPRIPAAERVTIYG